MNNYITSLKKEFGGYSGKRLAGDMIAGVTVAAVAMPLSIAFAVSGGYPISAGILSSIISGLIIGVLAGASFQISGPTGAMTTILLGLTIEFGPQGVFITGFLAGIILLFCSFLKVGRLVSFIPPPVITGFISGVAFIIALGQVNSFFGIQSIGTTAMEKMFSYLTQELHPDWRGVIFGLLAMAVMIFWPARLSGKFPASLGAIIACLGLNAFLKMDVTMVGAIPASIIPDTRLDFLSLPWSSLDEFMLPAFTIAALCIIESLLCGASGAKVKGEKLNGDRELFAQGIGNIILPLFGAVPAASAFSRTGVALRSMGTTRLTSVFHSVAIILAMVFLRPVISVIPLSALAGILFVTAWKMNNFESIRYIFSHRFSSSIMQFIFTFACTIIFDLTTALFVGLLVSILIFLVNISDMEISVSDVDKEKLKESGISIKDDTKKIRIVYLVGPVFFGNMEKLEEAVFPLENNDIIIFSMRGVPFMDAGSAQVFLHMVEHLKEREVVTMFSSLQPRVRTMLDRAGVTDAVGEELFFWEAQSAIAACNKV